MSTNEIAMRIVKHHVGEIVTYAALVNAIDASLAKAIADERDARWQPIETCPDNTTVMFWNDGIRIGRMQHGQPRVGGFNQDYFWGGEFDDDNPPTHWQPEPPPPTIRRDDTADTRTELE